MQLAVAVAAHALPSMRVAVDLSFGSLMSLREHRSLLAQVMRIYGNNRRHASPVDLHFSGLGYAPSATLPPPEHLRRWEADGHVKLLQPPAQDVWTPDEVIWLSPDASEPLSVADLQCSPERHVPRVLVVGGLIDRSVKKGRTLQLACDSGAEARRLPVREHAPRPDVHPILTCVACVQILCELNGGASWPDAIGSAIPHRSLERRRREEAQRHIDMAS